MPMAAAPSPRRSPIWRSACRGPLVLIVGMLSTKDCEGFLRNFSGLARRVIAVPIHQDKALPAGATWPTSRRGIGIPAMARDDVESALDSRRQARP